MRIILCLLCLTGGESFQHWLIRGRPAHALALITSRDCAIDRNGSADVVRPQDGSKLQELAAFKAQYGHVDVPLGNELGKWVYAQRRQRAEGRLAPATVAALDDMGLHWRLDPDELPWDELMARLAAYQAKHGDAFVPKKFVEDPLLGAWVAACRRRRMLLPAHRRAELDAAGFEWAPKSSCGSAFMVGLRGYTEARLVGRPAPDAQWVAAQREARRKGKLSEMRVEYLDGAGFEWDDDEAGETGSGALG